MCRVSEATWASFFDKLTVAGTEMTPGEAPAQPNVLETSEVPVQHED